MWRWHDPRESSVIEEDEVVDVEDSAGVEEVTGVEVVVEDVEDAEVGR